MAAGAAEAPEELARRIGLAWEGLPEPRHPFSLEAIPPGRKSIYVNLGPHPPRLWPEDLVRLQEVIFTLQPDVIIETGVAHGGSLIFYASLFKAMGSEGRVVGVLREGEVFGEMAFLLERPR